MRIVLTLVICCLFLASCSDKSKEKCAFIPDTGRVTMNLRFESLEDSLVGIKSKAGLVALLSRHPVVRDAFFGRSAYPNDSVFINELYSRFTNPYLDTLLAETHKVFGDGSELKKSFEEAYRNLKFYYPDYETPKIETVITGLESDLFVSDSLVIIGLDYFLGDGARYRPNMYDYMLRRYNKDFIIPSVFLLTGIDRHFNRIDPSDKTILADMVTYGKAFYFAKRMLPCTPDSVLIGYSAKEIEGSRQYENMIWSRFVEDEVLFSTSHLIKQKFLAERPKTVEVGDQCPGRIGTWVGWQIVNKFMNDNPRLSLQQLMQIQNASQLFKDSGYKPSVVKVPGKGKV